MNFTLNTYTNLSVAFSPIGQGKGHVYAAEKSDTLVNTMKSC